MVSKLSRGKIKVIILTLLITNPDKKFSAKDLSEFINSYNFGIWEKVTPNRIGSILRSANSYNHDMLGIIQHEKNSQNRTVYWVDTL